MINANRDGAFDWLPSNEELLKAKAEGREPKLNGPRAATPPAGTPSLAGSPRQTYAAPLRGIDIREELRREIIDAGYYDPDRVVEALLPSVRWNATAGRLDHDRRPIRDELRRIAREHPDVAPRSAPARIDNELTKIRTKADFGKDVRLRIAFVNKYGQQAFETLPLR